MKAMILAAGMGTRLGSITDSMPKVLVDINGKNLLQRSVEKCTLSGFDEIIINVHHYADLVEEEAMRLNRLGFSITVSDERDQLLDTGGGLFRARGFFDDSPFLLYNADIITDLDLKALYGHHLLKGGLATLAVRNRPGNRFLLIDRKGILRGWYNKNTGEKILSSHFGEDLTEIAFSGIHIIEPEIFKYMSEGVYSMTAEYLRLAGSRTINTFLHNTGVWFDAGTPERLNEARVYLKNIDLS